MFSSFSSFAVAVLPIIGLAAASPTVTPYTDGQCKAVVPNYSYNIRNGTQMVNTPFSTGAGVSAFGNATLKGNYEQYSNLSFSVPAIPNGLGQSIFWKVSGLDSGCRVIFMKPFVNPATGPNIPGQVVLNVGNANECYYTDPGETVFMSFCCGIGDCSAFNVGATQLNTKRDALPSIGGGPSNSIAAVYNQAVAKAKRGPQPKRSYDLQGPTPNLGSLPGRAQAQVKKNVNLALRDAPKTCNQGDKQCFDDQWKACTISVADGPFAMPGQQVAVSDFVTCQPSSLEGCPFTTSQTYTFSSEVSTSQTNSDTTSSSSSQSSSQTNTNTVETQNRNGYSLTVGASIGWGVLGASTSATKSGEDTKTNTQTNTQTSEEMSSTSFANTVANTSGHALTTAQSDTLSQTIQIIPGGTAALTFLPSYDCWSIKVDCGFPWIGAKGNTSSVSTQVCQPSMSGQKVSGSYSLLYTNQANA